MVTIVRLCFALSLLLPLPLQAQQRGTPDARRYDAERSLIESTLHAVVTVLQEATLHHADHAISRRLREMTTQLNQSTQAFQPAPPLALHLAPPVPPAAPDDLARLAVLLRDLHAQIQNLRATLETEQDYETANRLAEAERGLYEAVTTVEAMTADTTGRRTAGRWLRPGRYDGDDDAPAEDADDQEDRFDEELRDEIREDLAEARREIREELDWTREDEEDRAEDDWDRRRHRWHRPAFARSYTAPFIGDLGHDWPYPETALYRPIPALRYNRVEGLVLGIGVDPLEWDDYERNKVYGQAGYAFALDRWRYEAGLETRLGDGYRSAFNTRLGGNYHHNTATDDVWKSSWIENSLAAFFFKNDFFDYYQVEGWTVYGIQQLSTYAQLSAGYRADTYSSLTRNTSWALFGGEGFRPNPAVEEGRMHSLVFAFEGGRVEGLEYLPSGAAFRAEVEIGDGLGGDFSFNRYVADGRAYLPVSRHSTLALRLRGGLATGTPPIQKLFDIGGVGTVRAYPQNAFYGSRMLLGNVEYAFEDVQLFDELVDDVQLFGFADAGWVNDQGTNRFDVDDLLAAAGFGLGLDDRTLRLELAWPLRDVGYGREASLWLRLTPTF